MSKILLISFLGLIALAAVYVSQQPQTS